MIQHALNRVCRLQPPPPVARGDGRPALPSNSPVCSVEEDDDEDYVTPTDKPAVTLMMMMMMMYNDLMCALKS